MQFIRGDYTESGIAEFPPKLMANGDHFYCPSGLGSILNGMDHPRRGEEEHQHDKHGNHSPGEFHLIAAVNLRRFATIVTAALAELHDRIYKKAEKNYKNETGDRQD